MREINLETLSEETARQVITVLDLLSASEENILVLSGKEAIYRISKIKSTEDIESSELASEIEKQISKEHKDAFIEFFQMHHSPDSFADTLDELLDGPPMLKDKYMKGDPDQLRRDAWGGRGVR